MSRDDSSRPRFDRRFLDSEHVFSTIGKGRIGKRGFAHFLLDPRFVSVPMILETPKGKDGRGTDLDTANLKRLRALIPVKAAE